MRRIPIIIVIMMFVLPTGFSSTVFGYGSDAHEHITKQAYMQSMQNRAPGSFTEIEKYARDYLGYQPQTRFRGPAHSKYFFVNQFASDENWNAEKWIMHGAEAEDEPMPLIPTLAYNAIDNNLRANSHYYNPVFDDRTAYPYEIYDIMGSESWVINPYPSIQRGGLYDTPMSDKPYYQGKPTPSWAYDDSNARTTWTRYGVGKNFFSWVMAKEYLWTAVTGNCVKLYEAGVPGFNYDFDDPDGTQREETTKRAMALFFRSMGQVVHLLQDMSVPEHTRNDAHGGSSYVGYEREANKFKMPTFKGVDYRNIVSTPEQPFSPSEYHPQGPFFDFFEGEQGLASISNRNYLSKDSIPYNIRISDFTQRQNQCKYFEEPRIDTTQSEMVDYPYANSVINVMIKKRYFRHYYQLTTGPSVENVRVRLATSRFVNDIVTDLYVRTSLEGPYNMEDEECYKSYMSTLMPLAASYSAALMDYMTRGQIDIKFPDDGDFILSDNPYKGYTKIKILAKNATLDDDLADGDIQLVVKYRENGNADEYNYVRIPYTDAAGNEIRSIPNEFTLMEFEIEDENNYIPLDASHLQVYLTYRGALGLETDGIAIGHKNFSLLFELDHPEKGLLLTSKSGPEGFSTLPRGFTQVRLRARNITPNGLRACRGHVALGVQYKTDASGDEYERQVSVWTDRNDNVYDIPRDDWQEFRFYFRSNPIPFDAKDIHLTLFRYVPPSDSPGEYPNESGCITYEYGRLVAAEGGGCGMMHIAGTFEIDLPANGNIRGVYAVGETTNQESGEGHFSKIAFNARDNTAETIDLAGAGDLNLVIEYRTLFPRCNPFVTHGGSWMNYPQYYEGEDQYKTVRANVDVTTITASGTDITFILGPSEPIPYNATSLRFYLTYRGPVNVTLDDGTVKEIEDGFAIGCKDVSEPTQIRFINNMDVVCDNGQWREAGLQASQEMYRDAYEHDMGQFYVRFGAVNDYSYASSNGYHAESQGIEHGKWEDFFIITNYKFNYSFSDIPVEIADPVNDHYYYHPDFSEGLYVAGNAMHSQLEVYDQCGDGGRPCLARYVPTFNEYRGMECFNGLPFVWSLDYNCSPVPDIPMVPNNP